MIRPHSFGRRLDGVGGRRCEGRTSIAIAASLFSMRQSRVVMLTNISRKGAMLKGSELPSACAEVWIRLGMLDIFGIVVWADRVTCGIRFDRPLGDAEIQQFEREVLIADGHELSPSYKSWFV